MVRDCIVIVSAAIVKKFCFVLSLVKNHVHYYCCHICKQEHCIHLLSPDILIYSFGFSHHPWRNKQKTKGTKVLSREREVMFIYKTNKGALTVGNKING